LIGIDGRCRHPHVSVGGRSAILETEGVILAIGALERPFPILGIVRLQREMSAPNERLLLAYSVEKLRFWSRSDRAALWSAIGRGCVKTQPRFRLHQRIMRGRPNEAIH
jgi:hypothetical protein